MKRRSLESEENYATKEFINALIDKAAENYAKGKALYAKLSLEAEFANLKEEVKDDELPLNALKAEAEFAKLEAKNAELAKLEAELARLEEKPAGLEEKPRRRNSIPNLTQKGKKHLRSKSS